MQKLIKVYIIYITCTLDDLQDCLDRIEVHPNFIEWPENPIDQMGDRGILDKMANPTKNHEVSAAICYGGRGNIRNIGKYDVRSKKFRSWRF